MDIILLADKNTTWLETHDDALQAIRKRGWQIKSVGLPSSNLDETTPDTKIYEASARNNWIIITRDRDFYDVAKTARLNQKLMTDVAFISVFMDRGEPVIMALEKMLNLGHLPENKIDRITNLEHYLDDDFKQYHNSAKAITIAKSTLRPQQQSHQDIVNDYLMRHNIDLQLEKNLRRANKLKDKDRQN